MKKEAKGSVEKRISIFIGRTIFFTSGKLLYQLFDWLLRFFSLVKKIVVILLTTRPCVGESAKGFFGFLSKRRRVLRIKFFFTTALKSYALAKHTLISI